MVGVGSRLMRSVLPSCLVIKSCESDSAGPSDPVILLTALTNTTETCLSYFASFTILCTSICNAQALVYYTDL